MQKTVLRYGTYGFALMILILAIEFLLFKDNYNFAVQEVIGYVTIVLSLLFVYFGIRHWRDKYNAGLLSFGQGLKLGTLITLFPSIAFGLITLLEMGVLDPEFGNKYYSHQIARATASTPPDKLQEVLQKLQAEKEMFASPFIQFAVMFLTVFLLGVVITVISALMLQRKPTANRASLNA